MTKTHPVPRKLVTRVLWGRVPPEVVDVSCGPREILVTCPQYGHPWVLVTSFYGMVRPSRGDKS